MNGGRQAAGWGAFGTTTATPFAEQADDHPHDRGDAGQENDGMFRGSAESSRSGRTGATAGASMTPGPPLKVLFVRLKTGGMRGERVVGERDRSVHAIPMPDDPEVVPERLFALCTESFGPGELDLVDDLYGLGVLPCERCFAEMLMRAKPAQ